MRRIFSTLIVISCVQYAVAQTEETFASSTLTFKEAVKIGLQNNVTLNQQRNNLLQSQAQKTMRIAQLGPQVSINGNAGIRSGNNWIQNTGEVVNATVDGASASIDVTMPIFNGMAGVNNARQASNQLDAQMEQVNRSTQDVINLVSIQFLQVLLDQQLLKIANENLALQKTQLDQVLAQVELGSRSPVDEFNQKAQVSNSELLVAQAEFNLINDKITLFQTLLIDPVVQPTLEEPGWDVNSIALDNQDLNQLLQTASAQRSDLKQAQFTEKASKLSMYSSKGSYLPSVNAQYSYGSRYNQVRGTPRDSSFRDFTNQMTIDNVYQSLGVGVTIPIFTGFRNRSTYVQSKVLYENNRVITQNREVIVKGDVVRAYRNFESVKKGYMASADGLEASQMAFNLEKERYDLGVTSFVDFATANRTYVQAQTNMAQAKYRFLFQKLLLDYALGTLRFEDIP
jgi:outer membrane protein